jgi:hypothetical protein
MGAELFDRTLGTAKERRMLARLREMPDTLMPELDVPELRPRARARWADDLPPAAPVLDGQAGLFGDEETE